MKNINTSNKTFKRALYVLLAGMFATSISTQALELVEVEKINPASFAIDIQNNLQMSLNTTEIKVQTELLAQSMLTKEAKLMTKNPSITLAKTTVIAE